MHTLGHTENNEMTLRVRLAIRYSADLEVSLQGELWPEPVRLQVRDISRGGIFVRTRIAPEIFSELRVTIELPWGGRLDLAARVVHIVSPERSGATGMDAGMGLEFLDLRSTEKEVLQRLVQWASDRSPKRCQPIRTPKRDPGYLNPMQKYVLAAVDGERSLEQIAELLQLESLAAQTVLGDLEELSLVSVKGGQSSGTATGAPPRHSIRAAAGPTLRAGAALVDSGNEPSRPLSQDQKDAIDAMNARLAGDHYQVLGVSRKADLSQIREAYQALSARFGAEAFKQYSVASYQPILSKISKGLLEAYGALRNPSTRREYDGYLRTFADATAEPEKPAAPPPKVELGVLREAIGPRTAAARPAVTVATRRPALALPKLGRAAISRNGGQPEALSPLEMYLEQAEKAADNGDMAEAGRLLELVEAWGWCKPDLPSLYGELERKVAIALVDRYRERALYETKQQNWQQAARSWLKVCLARPKEARCHRYAAEALMMGKGDLHKARDLALRAVDLDPNDIAARRVLGHIYMEAGLHLSARRQLEAAAKLDRSDGGDPASSPLTPAIHSGQAT